MLDDCLMVFKSNLFEVRDTVSFDEICERFQLEKTCHDHLPDTVGFIKIIKDVDAINELNENSILDSISTVLTDGETCIVFEIKWINNKYGEDHIHAWSAAIDSNGEEVDVALTDIYDKIRTDLKVPGFVGCF